MPLLWMTLASFENLVENLAEPALRRTRSAVPASSLMIVDLVARIPCGNESGSIPNQSECVLIDMQILVGKAAPGHLGLVFDKVFD